MDALGVLRMISTAVGRTATLHEDPEMFRALLTMVTVLAVVNTTKAAVQTKTITYKDGDTECKGYLAYDDAVSGRRPGVLVVHEIWGLNDYARGRAEQLAKMGYIALAADMFGEGKTSEHPQEAMAMGRKVRQSVDAWRRRALAAIDVLKAQPQCDGDKLGAIGYCFGGSTVLELAYGGADLKAVVSFHGALVPAKPDEVKNIKAAILVCHGGADSFIPAATIKAFRDALDAGGVKYEFVAYPGVVHSFTVPGAEKRGMPGIKYDKHADEDSWKRMEDLFKEKLGK
jgi:dienelactone hydrolase